MAGLIGEDGAVIKPEVSNVVGSSGEGDGAGVVLGCWFRGEYYLWACNQKPRLENYVRNNQADCQ